jgi:hypothetical protein
MSEIGVDGFLSCQGLKFFKRASIFSGTRGSRFFGDMQFSTLDRSSFFSLKPSSGNSEFISIFFRLPNAPEKLRLKLRPVARLAVS